MTGIEFAVIVLGTLVPIAAYYAIYRLVDSPTVSGRLALLGVGWGVIVRFVFFLVITPLVVVTGLASSSEDFTQFGAPILGEVLKAIFLFWIFSRRRLTRFMDGALYGAAVGVGLAVEFMVESIVLPGAVPLFPVLVSNNTVRAITGAMVGFALGMAYFQSTTLRRWAWMAAGLLVAIFWGTTYSVLGALVPRGLLFVYAIIFSVSGVGLMLAAARTAQLAQAFRQIREEKKRTDALLHGVIPMGVALSSEREFDKLLERIIKGARSFTNADGSTLFLRTADEHLEYVVMQNETLGIEEGGTIGEDATFDPIALFDDSGQPDSHHVASHVAHEGKSVNIDDVYEGEVPFTGPREFDRQFGYRTQSMLAVPLKNAADKVVGVLQLVNARDDLTGETTGFDEGSQAIVESLSALASAALVSYIRQESLRSQASAIQVNVEADEVKRQVGEITDSEFFQELQGKLGEIRRRKASRLATQQGTSD